MNYVFDTKKLAEYIVDKHKRDKKNEISAIKLQKVLYFLFAYWGAYIRNANNGKIEDSELNKYDEYLFKDDIYAWTYGPVIKTIYDAFKKGINRKSDAIFNNDSFLKNNIDGLIDDLFELSDFKLVGMAHLDNCWKKNYIVTDTKHNKIINKEDIINEYAYKILQ